MSVAGVVSDTSSEAELASGFVFAEFLPSKSQERLRGEFVLVAHPAKVAQETGQDARVLKLLLAELPLKTAVKLAAEITGEYRNALYERALALKKRRCKREKYLYWYH